MKLGSLRSGGRDGTLVVVSHDMTRVCPVPQIAKTMQQALDQWDDVLPALRGVAADLNAGRADGALPYQWQDMHSPLPRAYQWADGSAYLHHVRLVRKARGAEMPPSFLTDPLMYQGGSDSFVAPSDAIEVADTEYGIDLEAEVAVVTTDVPMGISPEDALEKIALVMLVNDVSLRKLIPAELEKGFGFFHSKPASAFSPVAVTLDELQPFWQAGKLHLPLHSQINGQLLGQPNAGQGMQFHFGELIAHAAKTRHLVAGTIIGSGTVSNENPETGSSCLAEKRTIEILETGQPQTSFLNFGDQVRIEMFTPDGTSVFGKIEQVVRQYRPS